MVTPWPLDLRVLNYCIYNVSTVRGGYGLSIQNCVETVRSQGGRVRGGEGGGCGECAARSVLLMR